MRWIIPARKEPAVASRSDELAWIPDFNMSLLEGNNGGDTCLVEPESAVVSQHAADKDIREGDVKRFGNVDDMLSSLKQPW